MSKKYAFAISPFVVAAAVAAGTLVSWAFSPAQVARAQDEVKPIESGGNGPEKAIISTAEVMKLLIDPTYETLKNAVENPPVKRAEWRALYIASFSLAELTNLNYSRGDEEFQKTPEWPVEVKRSQEIVTKLAESVRAQSDYAVIKENYMAVLTDCNECHRKFKPGEIDEVVPPESWGAAAPKAPEASVVQ